jgi:uncharacterized protein YktA (UPF0223 family)
MAIDFQEGITRAGDVKIEQLVLISSDNKSIDLSEFLVELNIYEDIFSNYLRGNIVLTDSRNLIEKLNIHGEELLLVKIRTPSLDEVSVIKKTFRTFKLSDRKIVRDNNTQNYTIHFVSAELFVDVLLPLFVSFEGDIDTVVENIFTNYIATNSQYDLSEDQKNIKQKEDLSPLVVLNGASNRVKFVSPGWSPFKCINWLATKAIPKDGNAKNFLFFESSKSFYFGSIEYIFKNAVETNNIIGEYTISTSNITGKNDRKDLGREYFIAQDVDMVTTVDQIKNFTNGFLANRLVYLDVHNKIYNLVDYDYVEEYKAQYHTSGKGENALPPFSNNSLRNFATDISFYPKNPKLFDGFTDNVNEKMDVIYGNRKSSLLDLNNIRMNISVPGRTDVEVGRLLYFIYPSLGPKDQSDLNSSTVNQDTLYSGYYLITAINHKINRHEHIMTMEIVKDSLNVNNISVKK